MKSNTKHSHGPSGTAGGSDAMESSQEKASAEKEADDIGVTQAGIQLDINNQIPMETDKETNVDITKSAMKSNGELEVSKNAAEERVNGTSSEEHESALNANPTGKEDAGLESPIIIPLESGTSATDNCDLKRAIEGSKDGPEKVPEPQPGCSKDIDTGPSRENSSHGK